MNMTLGQALVTLALPAVWSQSQQEGERLPTLSWEDPGPQRLCGLGRATQHLDDKLSPRGATGTGPMLCPSYQRLLLAGGSK